MRKMWVSSTQTPDFIYSTVLEVTHVESELHQTSHVTGVLHSKLAHHRPAKFGLLDWIFTEIRHELDMILHMIHEL